MGTTQTILNSFEFYVKTQPHLDNKLKQHSKAKYFFMKFQVQLEVHQIIKIAQIKSLRCVYHNNLSWLRMPAHVGSIIILETSK